MNASIYIDSKKSTIRVEGPIAETAVQLGTAIAQILEGYFPREPEKQLAWISGISYAAMSSIYNAEQEVFTHEA